MIRHIDRSNEIRSDKYYGVERNGEIGVLNILGSGHWDICCLSNLYEYFNNKPWPGIHNSASLCINGAMNAGFKVYEIDTFREFAEWMFDVELLKELDK
jgi:hypothetical protein